VTQVLAVVGPTASGKTALAIELALRLDTEILSADSMQIYRGMEIGTGAPTPDERARVSHHFVGIIDPDEPFSAGEYQRQARQVVESLNAHGKPAVVVGGSGLYVRALIDGLFEGPPKDTGLREHLHSEAEQHGVGQLYERLRCFDPDYARAILPNDLRRIVRALEVFELTGTPLSEHHRRHRERIQPLAAIQVALDWPRDALYRRIDARVDRMVSAGFVEEVRRLVHRGYAPHLLRLRSLGYREFIAYLNGGQSLEQAAAATKLTTRRFAKRQLTWFRPDKRIHWLPATDDTPTANHIEAVLRLVDQQASSRR
jgi:tRNA dimethylallyltransferase